MIVDLKQQKIGFQEKIAFIKRILKKHIYYPIRTRLHFPLLLIQCRVNPKISNKPEMLHMYWETCLCQVISFGSQMRHKKSLTKVKSCR